MDLDPAAMSGEEREFLAVMTEAADRLIKLTAYKSNPEARSWVAQALKQGGTIEVRIQVEPVPVVGVFLVGPEGDVPLAVVNGDRLVITAH